MARLLWAAFLVLVSGCTSALNDGSVEVAEAAEPVPGQWFLTEDLALVPEGLNLSSPQTVPLAWSYGEWASGEPAPTWHSDPVESPIWIESAEATLYYSAGTATVASQARDPLTAWFGVEGSFVSHSFDSGPAVMAQGDIVEGSFHFELPLGGLAVQEQERLALRVGSYYADSSEAGTVQLLVGSETTESHLRLHARQFQPQAYKEVELLRESGRLRGTACPAGGDAAESAAHRFSIPVNDTMVGLRLELQRAGGSGGNDMDFLLYGPGGKRAAAGESSTGDESVTLLAPNLEAAGGSGDWGVEVFNCLPQSAVYRLTAWALLPPVA